MDPRIERLREQENAGQLDLVSLAEQVTSAQRDRLIAFVKRVAGTPISGDLANFGDPSLKLTDIVREARRMVASMEE